MKVAFVNLPYREPVMRRYVSSYFAPNFLMPPMELMGLAAIVKEWKGGEVLLIDAMAERLTIDAVVARLRPFAPDLVVTLVGFYIFGDDMAALAAVKAGLPPATRIACLGYLPSQYPEDVLRNGPADIVLMDEPELSFSDAYDRLAAGQPLDGVAGVAFRDPTASTPEVSPDFGGLIGPPRAGGARLPMSGKTSEVRVVVNPRRERLEDLDRLPFPDHSLINPDLYNESYLGRRIATVMTSRGCPFGCTYCIRTFGRGLTLRSAENVLTEIERLVRVHGIRHIRFMDDTLAVDRRRAEAIFRGLIERQLDILWTCFTRLDTLDEDLVRLMRRAGCRRMYVGIESGSPRILARLKKGITVETIERQTAMVRRAGVEVLAFFIVGAPGETEADLRRSIALAKRLDIDYVIVTQIQAWPGTELWRQWRDRVRFSLFPFRWEWDEPRDVAAWERRFYREFYLRPSYALRRLREFGSARGDLTLGLARLVAYLLRRDSPHDFI